LKPVSKVIQEEQIEMVWTRT